MSEQYIFLIVLKTDVKISFIFSYKLLGKDENKWLFFSVDSLSSALQEDISKEEREHFVAFIFQA